jgi:cyanate permease
MLGLSKGFIIAAVLATIIGYGTHSINNFLVIIITFVIAKIILNILS